MSLAALSLTDAAADIRDGRITSAELVTDCLKRVDEVEPEVQAWAFLDRDHVMRQAQAADEHRRHGRAHRAAARRAGRHQGHFRHRRLSDRIRLAAVERAHAAAGCGRGCAAARGRRRDHGQDRDGRIRLLPPRQDAQSARSGAHAGRLVERLGGGRRSRMVPGAIGSQTNGSTIRPAAFCGVVGFKPTHGLIPRTGALMLSRALDHVGVFARSVEDAALLAEVMAGHDGEDADTRPLARPPLAATAASEPPLPPRFAFVRSPAWKFIEPVMSEAFAELVEALGDGRHRGRVGLKLRQRDRSAPHRHGSRHGAQSPSRLRAGARAAQRARCAPRSSAAAMCRPWTICAPWRRPARSTQALDDDLRRI